MNRTDAYAALCAAAARSTDTHHTDPAVEAELLAARIAHTLACGVPADPMTGLDTRELDMAIANGTIALGPDHRVAATRWAGGEVTHGGTNGHPLVFASQRQTDEFKPDRQTISGFCGNAARNDGEILLESGYHLHCRGLVVQPRPGGEVAVALCACPCEHPSYSDATTHEVVNGYACHSCNRRFPLMAKPTHNWSFDGDAIDPRTGTCVDRVACDEMVEMRRETSTLRKELRMPRRSANANDAATEQEPKAARVKEGTCEHCGTPTKGGKFAPGHDAILKGQLTKVYLDREAADRERVDALAEAIVRAWLRYPAGHDNPGLIKGIKAEDTGAKAAAIAQFDSLVDQARQQVSTAEAGNELVERRSKARQAA